MRTMLADSGAPKYLWGEAVLNAVYTTNRSPTEALSANYTPAECWHGEKPDVRKLRVFGCQVFAWIPKQKRSKLDSTGLRGVMLGYSPTGYRLWNQTTRKMFVARDVKFNEKCFPFTKNSLEEEDSISKLVIPEVIPVVEEIKTEDVHQTIESVSDAINDDPVLPENEFEDAVTDTNDDGATALPPQSKNRNECEESVPRSSGRERRTPGWFADFIAPYRALSAADEFQQVPIPTCYDEVDGHPHEKEWRNSIQDELRSLIKNQTWIIVRCPDEVKPVPSKWVFTLKTDADGNPVRYKARLVAKGYMQRKHIDYEETFAPVAKLSTIRTILAIAVNRDLKIHQMDVKTAFLNGILQEKVYMSVPEGVSSCLNEVCLLKKSLYGLKQSPRCWNGRFNEVLVSMGFVRSRHDYCLYVRGQGNLITYIIIYVDDLLVVAADLRTIEDIKQCLKREFEMTDLNELHHFLGIKIERDRNTMYLSQEALIRKILTRFGMDACKPANTPAEIKLQLRAANEGCSHPYRELVGSLMFLMLGSRPDLCYIVGYLARFQDAAGEEHWKHAKRVLRYLQATKELKLTFRRNPHEQPVIVFVDADYAGDELDRKCVSGYLIKVFGCTVVWSSKKQRTVAMSSTEAEYIAMSSSISETIWITGLLADLRESNLFPVPIFEDNQGAIKMAEKEETKRVKHIDVKFHFIRDTVTEGKVKLVYVPSQQQEADLLTKSLPAPTLNLLRTKIGLKTIN